MPLDYRQLQAALLTRLQRGEQLILYGPRGSGKSTLLESLHSHFVKIGTPCAVSDATAHLDDITRAFARAYPHVDTVSTTRRRARGRLLLAADRNGGILLLDHVTDVSNAMLGYLRRLRGGIAAALLVVDVDADRERQRLRRHRLGMFWVPMPPYPPRQLQRLFSVCRNEYDIAPIAPDQVRRLLAAARGRPGWIVTCTRLMRHRRYWHDDRLYTSLLSVDTEITLRQGTLKLLLPADGPG